MAADVEATVESLDHPVDNAPVRPMTGWAALQLTTGPLELHYGSILQLLISGGITFMLGGPVGAFILGLHLFISIRVFRKAAVQ